MNKPKLNHTLISFLPILVSIPLFFQLIKDLHFGGIELFYEFLLSAFYPKINNEIILIIINRLNETIFIALISWIISLLFGVIFGILSSDILFKLFSIPKFIQKIIINFLTILRSLHELVWCLVLMQIYGINISVAIIAITIPYAAINAKVIKEQLENINSKTIESIIQIKGKKLSSLITIIWVPISKTLKNFGIYRLECAFRSTAILGLFGIGGIGTSIFLSFQAFNFRELWTYLWSLALLILLTNKLFKNLQFNKLDGRIRLISLIFSGLLILFASCYFLYSIFNENLNINYLILSLSNRNNYLLLKPFFNLILDTIILTLLATGITISLPPIIFLISNRGIYINLFRFIFFFMRLIPPPITILILLMFNAPSISLAALTLGLHNASITFKLLNNNLNQIDKREYNAIKSLGASKRISWLYGLFIKQSKSYLAYCAYRADIIIRETAIVGVIGSIGLGWQLRESLSSFAWEEVLITLFTYSLIAIIGELINGKIKANLN